VCTTVGMRYSHEFVGQLGTASKTITLDLSAWANLSAICNRKKWNLKRCISYLAAQENEIQIDVEKSKLR